ncbi:phospho-acceptor domain-containing protein [Labedella gwakjiensis]|nr:HAMP domain-containing sensor histidine kinase [Labedella gwakjiensis]PSL36816.1 phospho-acceptor domain-containing protein [Labedella gwakjiensis]
MAASAVLIRRRDVFWRGQAPFVFGTVVLVGFVLIGVPSAIGDAFFLLGLGVTALATASIAIVPWNQLPSNALIAIPLSDIVAVAFLRESLYAALPSTGLLIVFPVMWLSYRFPVSAIPLSAIGALYVTALPILAGRPAPATGRDWASLFLLPALITIVAVTVHAAARLLRATRAEARRVLNEAEQANALALTVANSVDAAIVHFLPDGSVGMRNQATFAQAEIAEYDKASKSALAAYEADRRTPLRREDQPIYRALRGEEFRGLLYWIGRPGNQHAIVANSVGVHTDDGAFLGTVLVGHDVTDLANAISVREEFLVAVSHELRTPLTSIIGYLDILSDAHDLDALGIRREVSTIQRNADQLHAIISDLLTSNASEIRVRPGPVDLAHVVRECAEAVAPRAHVLGIDVEVDAPERFDADADASRIGQVIDNLLSNGLKYTPRGGRVSLSLVPGDTEFSIVVTDTGIGISQSDQRQLFDRFFRAQEVRDQATQGLGLGLSIVRTIVDAHHGRIDVESLPGKGSRFTVTLPLHQRRR